MMRFVPENNVREPALSICSRNADDTPSGISTDNDTPDMICGKIGEGLIPDRFVHAAVKIVPLEPWSIAAAQPYLLAVNHELCSFDVHMGVGLDWLRCGSRCSGAGSVFTVELLLQPQIPTTMIATESTAAIFLFKKLILLLPFINANIL